MTVSLLTILARKLASSIAVSPPPTTPTSFPEEEAVAGGAGGNAMAGEGLLGRMSSHFAEAPVAMITVSAASRARRRQRRGRAAS